MLVDNLVIWIVLHLLNIHRLLWCVRWLDWCRYMLCLLRHHCDLFIILNIVELLSILMTLNRSILIVRELLWANLMNDCWLILTTLANIVNTLSSRYTIWGGLGQLSLRLVHLLHILLQFTLIHLSTLRSSLGIKH